METDKGQECREDLGRLLTLEKLQRAKGMMELGSRLQVLLGGGEVDAALRPWCVHVLGPLPQNATWGAGPQQLSSPVWRARCQAGPSSLPGLRVRDPPSSHSFWGWLEVLGVPWLIDTSL